MQQSTYRQVRYPRTVALVTAAVLLSGFGCSSDPAVDRQKYLESGNRYFDQGQYESAIIEYRNAIAVDARFGSARKRLGEAYARTGNAPGALEEYVRAADLLPDDVDVQLDAGSLLLAARRFDEAIMRADAALKVNPSNAQALVLRGGALAGLTSYDDALETIEDAIQLDPNRGRTYTSLGVVEMARGRADQAEKAFQKAVEVSPNDVQTLLSLGNFYWAARRPHDAERAFLAALKLDPANRASNRFMASFTFSTGRRDDAEQYLARLADSSKELADTYALTDYYMIMERPQDAIIRLNALPDSGAVAAVKLRLARAHASAGDMSKATALVDDVLKANKGDADAQLLKGRLLLQQGQGDAALTSVRAAASTNPSSAEAQFTLGRIYAVRGDSDAAQSAFREVLKINPRAVAAQVELARLQTRAGTVEQSLNTAEEATRNNPDHAAARLELLRSLIASKNVARAERELAELKADFPNMASVYVQESALAVLKNNTSAARSALERAEMLDPDSFEVLTGFVTLDLKLNDFASVKARLENHLQRENSAQVLLLAGRAYFAMKDWAAGETALRSAISADPSLVDTYHLLGELYIRQNKLDLALSEFQSLAQHQQKPISALTMSGMILEQQGKTDLAKKHYEDVLALDSHAATAANNLAWLLAEQGSDLNRALELARTATAAAPDAPQVLDTLGWVYYKREEPDLAIPFLTRAAELDPTVSWYHYHAGLAYMKTGDTVRGRAALQRALKIGIDEGTASEIKRLLAEAGTPQ
jgi:tetratricopeptide (TPR) repeat protein